MRTRRRVTVINAVRAAGHTAVSFRNLPEPPRHVPLVLGFSLARLTGDACPYTFISPPTQLGTPPLLGPSSVAVWRHTGELFIAEPDQHMVRMASSPGQAHELGAVPGGAGAGRGGRSASAVLFFTFFGAVAVVAIMIAALDLTCRAQGFVTTRRYRAAVPKSYARGSSF